MITLEFSSLGVYFSIKREILSSLVNMEEFKDFCSRFNYGANESEYPLNLYFMFYDERSQILKEENDLSRSLSVGLKEHQEQLKNDVNRNEENLKAGKDFFALLGEM